MTACWYSEPGDGRQGMLCALTEFQHVCIHSSDVYNFSIITLSLFSCTQSEPVVALCVL